MRSRFIAAIVLFAATTATLVAQTKPAPALVVYKTSTCGCCAKWVEHMQANGFTARVVDVADTTEQRGKAGVPAQLGSCHTATIGGYAIEGHVPAADVKRLLREKPAIVGLAAPGMPAGSPGMDVPNSPPFDVIAFDKAGNTRVYATHR